MTNQDVCNTIGAKFHEKLPVDHSVVNCVDDSNNVITADPGTDIEKYTNSYSYLLEIYYFSRKLKINTDRTQLLVCSIPEFKNQIENMEMQTPDDPANVKPKYK